MKITKTELKQIIMEELSNVLNEGKTSFDYEGATTSIQFLGMETEYDQTEVKLLINGDEHSILGAYDIDSLADGVIDKIEEENDGQYWFLGDDRDDLFQKEVAGFKAELENALEEIGADPEGDEEYRIS